MINNNKNQFNLSVCGERKINKAFQSSGSMLSSKPFHFTKGNINTP
jgi:hypothetical protein